MTQTVSNTLFFSRLQAYALHCSLVLHVYSHVLEMQAVERILQLVASGILHRHMYTATACHVPVMARDTITHKYIILSTGMLQREGGNMRHTVVGIVYPTIMIG